MPAKVDFIPKGASAVTPYLVVSNPAAMIDFYKKGFGAIETMRLKQRDEEWGHAGLRISGASNMLADEFPEMGIVAPTSIGAERSPFSIHVYVDNVDDLYERALAAGATSLREVKDQLYGERNG